MNIANEWIKSNFENDWCLSYSLVIVRRYIKNTIFLLDSGCVSDQYIATEHATTGGKNCR